MMRGSFTKGGRISDYFDTKYISVLWIEQILHNSKDQKIANFSNLKQVNFRVTLVIYELSKDLGLVPCPFEWNTLIGRIQYVWFHIL